MRGTSGGSSSSGLPQQVLDILLPASGTADVRGSPDPPGLEKACGISLLKRHGEPGLPGVQEPDLSPVPHACDLRIGLSNCIGSVSEPTQSFSTPASEGFHREGDKTASRKGPCRVSAMLPLRRTGCGSAVLVRRRMEVGT